MGAVKGERAAAAPDINPALYLPEVLRLKRRMTA